jgi:hypothetical protein
MSQHVITKMPLLLSTYAKLRWLEDDNGCTNFYVHSFQQVNIQIVIQENHVMETFQYCDGGKLHHSG